MAVYYRRLSHAYMYLSPERVLRDFAIYHMLFKKCLKYFMLQNIKFMQLLDFFSIYESEQTL